MMAGFYPPALNKIQEIQNPISTIKISNFPNCFDKAEIIQTYSKFQDQIDIFNQYHFKCFQNNDQTGEKCLLIQHFYQNQESIDINTISLIANMIAKIRYLNILILKMGNLIDEYIPKYQLKFNLTKHVKIPPHMLMIDEEAKGYILDYLKIAKEKLKELNKLMLGNPSKLLVPYDIGIYHFLSNTDRPFSISEKIQRFISTYIW